ncbi:MAG: polysaccharide deacetylase family protein [Clostridia bacterium]|jgi:peptidoglycan/xylan/chitin deacetylase (PgdA/CDA1 family)
MFNKKMKAVTFSYDDGVKQDIRLIDIFNKYRLKATFNLNSELLGQDGYLIRENRRINHIKNSPLDIKKIYEGHEVAVHTLTHPNLTTIDDEEIIRQVEQDRINLSALVGYEVIGMAYPCGGTNNNRHVADIIRNCTKIRYARTITSSHSFDLQDDLFRFNPTAYHHDEMDMMFELGKKFIDMKADSPQILYIWGHSYEFDIRDDWSRFERFCRLICDHNDIFYGTNKEVLFSY